MRVTDFIGDINPQALPGPEATLETIKAVTTGIFALGPGVKELDIRIDVVGGQSHVGFTLLQLVNLNLSKSLRVNTTIEGLCLSTGALLAQCGTVRRMSRDGVLLIHDTVVNFSPGADGKITLNANSMRQFIGMLDEMNQQQFRIFSERSGRSESDLRELGGRYLNSDECLHHGLVDEIVEGRPLPVTRSREWAEKFMPQVEAALARRTCRCRPSRIDA
jgi:ATP-dependent protease ClpP protease subunit